MLFKLSNPNLNLTLTLGYLNPALNNSAQVIYVLHRIWLFNSELIKYVCIKTRNLREFTSLPIACSSQDSFAYNESLKTPNPHRWSLLIKILFLTTENIHVFKSNQCFWVIEFVDWLILEKINIFCINLSWAFSVKYAWHQSYCKNIPSFQRLH